MSLDWLPLDEFERCLERDYPPVGLGLRSFLDGRLEERIDLPELIGRPADTVEWFPGWGTTGGWTGIVNGIPFGLAAKPSGESMRWGFDLLLPVCVRPDGEWDVRTQLNAVSALPAAFRRNDSPWFECLPFAGSGWGVADARNDDPLFRAVAREDAGMVAGFLNEAYPGGYRVIPLVEPSPFQWIVVGPRTGRFISSVQAFNSQEDAEERAKRRSAETGVPFTVQAGRITAPA